MKTRGVMQPHNIKKKAVEIAKPPQGGSNDILFRAWVEQEIDKLKAEISDLKKEHK